MQQVIFDFGTISVFGLSFPLRVYGYGLMLVLGFVVALYVARWRARRAGEDPEHLSRCGLLALVGGIVGSRAAFIIQDWDSFSRAENPIAAMLNVTSGGLIYYGGVILATMMVLGYLFAKRLPVRRYLDILAASVMIGLAFGRAGCTLNGCCFGSRCEASWSLGIRFPVFSKPLVKFDGRANPYSADTDSPSPVYAHQLDPALPPGEQVQPPLGLRNRFDHAKVDVGGELRPVVRLLPPRDLHGPLDSDQTVLWADPNDEEKLRQAFHALAGTDGLLTSEDWQRGLAQPTGLLRGSEHWAEASVFDIDYSGALTWSEAQAYFSHLRQWYDLSGDGRLGANERAAANRDLQADQFALAAATHSLPVKPAQLLGVANALLLAGLLAVFYRFRRREGQVFAAMVIAYPTTRFVLEMVRDDNAHDLGRMVFTHNQITSILLVTIGILLWLGIRFLPASAGPTAAKLQAATVRGGRNHR